MFLNVSLEIVGDSCASMAVKNPKKTIGFAINCKGFVGYYPVFVIISHALILIRGKIDNIVLQGRMAFGRHHGCDQDMPKRAISFPDKLVVSFSKFHVQIVFINAFKYLWFFFASECLFPSHFLRHLSPFTPTMIVNVDCMKAACWRHQRGKMFLLLLLCFGSASKLWILFLFWTHTNIFYMQMLLVRNLLLLQ